MTILNRTIAPSFGVTPDEDYDSANYTFKADATGVHLYGVPLTLDAGCSLVLASGATVTGMPAGPQGVQGVQGVQGITGLKGDTGAQGPQGLQGLQGLKGDTGAKGDDGAKGSTGAAGVDGKRIDAFSGTTDTNGLFTVTFATAFPATPNIQPEPPTDARQTWVKVSASPTGFSLRLVQRNSVTLLSTDLLLASTVNVVGASVRAIAVAV